MYTIECRRYRIRRPVIQDKYTNTRSWDRRRIKSALVQSDCRLPTARISRRTSGGLFVGLYV